MMTLRIDGQRCDIGQAPTIPIGFDAEALTKVEGAREGRAIELTLPATPLNNALFGCSQTCLLVFLCSTLFIRLVGVFLARAFSAGALSFTFGFVAGTAALITGGFLGLGLFLYGLVASTGGLALFAGCQQGNSFSCIVLFRLGGGGGLYLLLLLEHRL